MDEIGNEMASPLTDEARQVPARRKKKSQGQVAKYASLILSAIWLVAALSVGISLLIPVEMPDPSMKGAGDPLASISYRQAYGGDAYTGIQNAASDTENAVVRAGNALLENDRSLANGIVVAQRQTVLRSATPIQRAAALLVIGSGITPFVLVLAILSRPRPRMVNYEL